MMRLSDVLTIYCAIGASFAAARLAQSDDIQRCPTRRAAELCLVFAFWFVPLIAAMWRGRKQTEAQARADRRCPHEAGELSNRKHVFVRDKYERARAALYAVQDEAESSAATRCAEAALERYVGLSLLAVDDTESAAAAPEFANPRLTKLQSLAGRSGDDLDCAARCIARRNRRVLSQHLGRARADLIEALRRTREGFPPGYSESLIRFYDRALELAATLDDAETHSAITHIIYGECAVGSATAASDDAAVDITSSRVFPPQIVESRTHRHAPLGSAG